MLQMIVETVIQEIDYFFSQKVKQSNSSTYNTKANKFLAQNKCN